MTKKLLTVILISLITINIYAVPFKFGASGSRNWFEADRSGNGYNLYTFGGMGVTPQFFIMLSKGFSEYYPNKDTMFAQVSQLELNGRYYFRDSDCYTCASPFLQFGAGKMTAELNPQSRFPMNQYDEFIYNLGLGIDFPISKYLSISILGKYNYTTCEFLDGIKAGEFEDGFYELNLGFNINLPSLFESNNDLDRLYRVNKIWPMKRYPEDRFVNNDPDFQQKYIKENKKLEKRVEKLEKENIKLEKKLNSLRKRRKTTIDTVLVEKQDTIYIERRPENNFQEARRRANTIEDIPLDEIYCATCNDNDDQGEIPLRNELDVDESIEANLDAFLVSWTNAWEAKDIDEYIQHYAPYFRSNNLSLQDYYRKKKRIFNKAGEISLILKDIHVINQYNSTIQVKFIQYYQADNYYDYGEKKLLIDTQNNYKIINESWKKQPMPSNFLR